MLWWGKEIHVELCCKASWKDNIKTDFIKCEVVKWAELLQDRVQLRAFVNTTMNLRVL